MIHYTDVPHQLAEDVVLVAPFGFKLSRSADGRHAQAKEVQTGSQLTYLCQAGPVGVSEQQALQSVVALFLKRHPKAELAGAPQPAQGPGWRGLLQMMRVGSALDRPLRILITVTVVADPQNVGQQRCLALALEVPDGDFDQRLMYYRKFSEERLFVGIAPTLQAGPPSRVPSTGSAQGRESALALEPMTLPEETPKADGLGSAGAGGAAPPPPSRPATSSERAPSTLRQRAPKPVPEPSPDERLEGAAVGQKAVIRSIALSFVVNAMARVPEFSPWFILLLSVAVTFYAVFGVLRMCSGFGLGRNPKLLWMFVSTVPLLNVICWVVFSIKTTRLLRSHGFEVGLFGVRA